MNPQRKQDILNNILSPKTVFLSFVLIITLGFTVYANSLNNGFIWDDQALIEDNSYVKSWSSLPQIFSQNIGAGAQKNWAFYRPLQMITYMSDYSLWKLDARGYHLTNILLHILAALSIYALLNTLFNDHALSFLTSALFVVHPIHTEVVTYISGRADSLAVLFTLLCFIFYIKSLPSKRAGMTVLMLSSYACALLSKESSLILPVLLLLYHYSFKIKARAKKFFPLVGIALIYILLRVSALKAPLADSANTSSLWQRLPGVFAALTGYLRLLFFPFHLHMEYGHPLFHWKDPKCIFGAILLLALLIYGFRKKGGAPLLFFSISWFFAALLPVLNLYPINAYMAEHWLYLPSIGFFLIIAKGIHSFYKMEGFRLFTILFVIGLLGWYSYLTVKQNTYWQDPIRFYERTLQYAPGSSRVYNNLGIAYSAIDKRDKAAAAYQKAIGFDPRFADAYFNLANIYRDAGKYPDAIAAYKKAVEIKPDYAGAYVNLGNAYDAIKMQKEAIDSYNRAIELKPDSLEAYNNLGTMYHAMNRNEDAIAAYKKAIEIKPDANTYYNLAIAYSSINKNEAAIASYTKAIELNRDFKEAYNNLAIVYFQLKQYHLAIKNCDRAKELGLANNELLEALQPYR
ncbi:MAG: tetratricopeptide repeat protein [Candidatus Omnitrophica bacterium]|nr:tetratricopeptide repeat protein [Candidatus Omnitrophota bacterium]